jgi:hypothetical protein
MKWLQDLISGAAGKVLSGWQGVAVVVGLAALYLVLVELPSQAEKRGANNGQLQCVGTQSAAAASAVQAGASQAIATGQQQLGQAAQQGLAHERVRDRIVTIYRNLETEASHAPTANADHSSCALPPERLRLWTLANDGPTDPRDPEAAGASIGQPAAAAAGAASAPERPDTDAGAQPPGSGASVPSTGSPGVRAAETHGDRAP